jgi:hypothetical protein
MRACKPRNWSEERPSGPSHGSTEPGRCLFGLVLSVSVHPVLHVACTGVLGVSSSGCCENLRHTCFRSYLIQ